MILSERRTREIVANRERVTERAELTEDIFAASASSDWATAASEELAAWSARRPVRWAWVRIL